MPLLIYTQVSFSCLSKTTLGKAIIYAFDTELLVNAFFWTKVCKIHILVPQLSKLHY